MIRVLAADDHAVVRRGPEVLQQCAVLSHRGYQVMCLLTLGKTITEAAADLSLSSRAISFSGELNTQICPTGKRALVWYNARYGSESLHR